MSRRRLTWSGLAILLAATNGLGGSSAAQATVRVSVDSAGAQADDFSGGAAVSDDGRYVAFLSVATNLVPGDTNASYDVFVRDRQLGLTERASVGAGGAQGNGDSYLGWISPDGRYVTFHSFATNLVPGDTNAVADAFVRDRQLGLTERVSVDTAEAQANGGSTGGRMSDDGRYVAFTSDATNLVAGDINAVGDVFVRDRQAGTTERVSVHSSGAQGNDASLNPSISGDGRFVTFASLAANLVAGDTNGELDAFLRDRQLGTTARVSLGAAAAQGNGPSFAASSSTDGRYVAFASDASNLVIGDTNGLGDIFVRDRQLGTTERVSVDSGEAQADDGSLAPRITPDGRFVSFASFATNLAAGDTNFVADTFLRDRQSGTTERVSFGAGGVEGNDGCFPFSISADGRYVGLESGATNLVPGDTNATFDSFLRDRTGGTTFTSLCDPGVGGVAACPCSNPPSGLGRGCDNSSATGGAILSASGGTTLSSDSLVFTTSGEKPSALSLVLQGNALLGSGVAYGQGVRCVGGALKRLYVKAASAGSITAPDFGAGDPSVHTRSAALGDPITAGVERWYLVYYRDATVLGGCSDASTFNATQTGRVGWSP